MDYAAKYTQRNKGKYVELYALKSGGGESGGRDISTCLDGDAASYLSSEL